MKCKNNYLLQTKQYFNKIKNLIMRISKAEGEMLKWGKIKFNRKKMKFNKCLIVLSLKLNKNCF